MNIVFNEKYGHIVMPDREYRCPFDGTVMLLHSFSANDAGFYHCDISLKCPKCGFVAVFGKPITEIEYKLLVKSKLHNKVITNIDEIYNVDKDIRKRIKELGYW